MKKYTQFGTFSVIMMLTILVLCIVMLFVIGFDETMPVIISGFVILTLVVCLLIFYKLTITIDDTHLTFKMGIGLIGKSYALSDIESCTPVRNSVMWGIGIRMTPSGWLYNVSGLSAIELTFKNRKTKMRIGTDRPEEIAEVVRGKITGEQAGSFYEKNGKQGIYYTVALLSIIIIIPVVIIVTGRRETEVTFLDSSLTISGMYGLSVSYTDIIQVDTLQVLPGIRARTNGFAAGKILKGHFKLDDQSKVMLFIREGIPPYISIKTTTTTIYLNSGNSLKTRELFKTIKDRTGSR
jgi:hypothetical protein